jgi:putative addiction module component (TIGR02574 family)
MTDKFQSTINDIKKLSVTDRISVIEDIWESILTSETQYSIPDEQRKELDIRLKENTKNPDRVKSWDEVKKNIKTQL